jgi:flagella basal body P-ring formation protein FlgA
MKKHFLSLSLVFSLGSRCIALVPEAFVIERLREEILKDLSPEIRISIENVHVQKKPASDASIVSLTPKPALGLTHFTLQWVEEGAPKASTGSAMVRAFQKVAVVRNPIKHQEPFTGQNISLEERDVSSLRATGFFSELKPLFDLRAHGYLSPGVVVGFQQTEEPWTVTAGQMLELVNQKGSLRVSARVVALENGRKSQWIRVENPGSKKVLRAKVATSGEVHLR